MPSKWVPNAAATPAESQGNSRVNSQVYSQGIPMTDISDFVQQSHNFIVV